MNFLEEKLNTKILAKCDVLVAGGGFAGISAALSAARCGTKVILCEREFALGGLATLGLITIYLPICDGEGNQVSFGIAEELFRLSIKHGYQDMYPKAWLEGGDLEEKIKNRYMVQYNPHIFEQLVEELLLDEGVEILYGTSICKTEVLNDKITHVVVENKSGRFAIEVKSVVDATGDADICYISGEDTEMNPRKNPLAAWYYYADNDGVHLVQHGYADVPNCSDEKANEALVQTRFDGVTAEELTKIMVLSRKHSISHILEKKKKNKEIECVTIPTIPQLRMTRRLKGKTELDYSHINTEIPDSIGVIGSWRKAGIRIEIPFSSLYGKKIKNLITAGRCISSKGDMWDLTRVIPCCAVTGEAAGTAAAMYDDFDKISVKELQNKLMNSNVKIHIKDCI